MELLPDTAQTLAVICSIAQGTSKITGLSTLRIKETDRLQALLNELGKCGIKTEIGADFIIVHGGTPHAARIATYEDHRMAMSFAGLASIVKGIEIEHPNVVNKSFPDFWQKYEALGIPYQSCA